jgi:isopentenyldiphosphate isomerase
MEKLRKHIKESFFNPIFHFLPLLLFLVVNDFFGMNVAWKVSFSFALILLIYVYFVFNRIFTWHLIFTLIFICVSTITGIFTLLPQSLVSSQILDEILVLSFLIIFVIFQKQIHKIVLRLMPNLIPMTNNFEELFRVIWAFLFVLLFYVASFLIVQFVGQNVKQYQQMLQYLYVGVLFFLSIYEILRVQIIRAKLIREEWWPIVNDQGKIIGSIQRLTSLNDEKKYMHPIVRVLIIDKSMILLQKRSNGSLIFRGLWDAAVSNHLNMGETIEQCVERTAKEQYSLSNFKYMYLANYTIEVEKEHHYAFLFVSCQENELKINTIFTEQLKWWTQQQIDENLNTGIFSDNFKVEYDLLKRSGLLETGKCECNCKLKEVIYQQSNDAKKE